MSFSGDTKTALAKIPCERDCCASAELCGMLIFASVFERNKTVFLSETEEAAYLFSGLLIRCLDVCSSPEVFSKGKSGTLVFRTTVCGEDAEKLYDFAFPNGECRIYTKKFGCDHCAEAFIRGAFLSCGFVNPPEKRYGIEFTVSNADIAVELATVLAYKFGMPKLSVRKGNQIVYYRGGEKVADVLMLIGAQNEAFEIMNSQALRSIRNEQNRQTNFEVANISKQSAASAEQIEAITELKKIGKFGLLSPVLRQTANLRLENPEASMAVLGKLENPPVSKSQESKRLLKIVDFYKAHKNN